MRMEHQQLIAGMIRLHILHHAAKQPLYGHWMIEELNRHGYKISAGTIYPLLHGMQRRGYLTSKSERANGRCRRMYRATVKGRRALQQTKGKIRELFKELI
jgi:PadR family transcriptional regulator PadR